MRKNENFQDTNSVSDLFVYYGRDGYLKMTYPKAFIRPMAVRVYQGKVAGLLIRYRVVNVGRKGKKQ